MRAFGLGVLGAAVVLALVGGATGCGHAGAGDVMPSTGASAQPGPGVAATEARQAGRREAGASAAGSTRLKGMVMDADFVKANRKEVLVSWYDYGAARAMLWKALIKRHDSAEDEFLAEVLTRELLAHGWRDKRAKGEAPDPYLDLMADLEREGLMKEYVLASFARLGWTVDGAELAKLDLPRYRAHAAAHLVGHRPLRPVRFYPPDGPASPPVPGATLPPLPSLDPQRRPCSTSRARVATALAQWTDEETQLDGAALAAADRAGFVRALEKVRGSEPFARRGATWVAQAVADLHQVAGFCAVEDGRWADAERLLAKAAALDPFMSVARSELALVYVRLGRLDDAERVTGQALELATNDCERARCLRQQGYLVIERGKLLEALQLYHRSLELAPGNQVAEHEVQVILNELRRLGGASAKAAADYRPPPTSPALKVGVCPR